jgi:hypothetical protein
MKDRRTNSSNALRLAKPVGSRSKKLDAIKGLRLAARMRKIIVHSAKRGLSEDQRRALIRKQFTRIK